MDIGIEKKYMKMVEKIAVKSKESFEEVLEKIESISDYVIISNFINNSYLRKYDFDYNTKEIKVKNEKIPVINISQIDGIFLLKKNDLPEINMCDFCEEWDSNCIDGSLFYEFIDCSKNEELRKAIINDSDWIKEIGNEEEQDNYLKEYCRIRLYLAFTITHKNTDTVLKFNNIEKE